MGWKDVRQRNRQEKWDEIVKWSEDAIKWIKDTWKDISTWFNDNVAEPIGGFEKAWTKIKTTWEKVSNWFMEKYSYLFITLLYQSSTLWLVFSPLLGTLLKPYGVLHQLGSWKRYGNHMVNMQ